MKETVLLLACGKSGLTVRDDVMVDNKNENEPVNTVDRVKMAAWLNSQKVGFVIKNRVPFIQNGSVANARLHAVVEAKPIRVHVKIYVKDSKIFAAKKLSDFLIATLTTVQLGPSGLNTANARPVAASEAKLGLGLV